MAFTYTGEQVQLGAGRGWTNRQTANSIFRIDKRLGHPMQITEAGRTRLQQNEHYQRYLRYGSPIALSPDAPSLHQRGNAVDSNEAQRNQSLMEEHGFRRTVYRYVNGKWTLVEPWHYEYFPEHDRHINEEIDDMGNIDNTAANKQVIADAIWQFMSGAGPVMPNGQPWPFMASVWNQPVQAQDANGNLLSNSAGKPITFPAAGFLASTSGQVNDIRSKVGVTPAQVKQIADAVVAAVGKPTVSIDYAAVAKSVNDDADARSLKRLTK